MLYSFMALQNNQNFLKNQAKILKKLFTSFHLYLIILL
ncbi:hypothetical protein CLOLEP_03015 [[Clostridium] leptum DSM 753]|uniref:Uncharacterized protein n=1 Tax=[Clostridium] leptum DSM 753 TaxID=428125 RepID=A7VWP5_9FIRM|nr:hypothetical protein CLOLEP_03015 [[Clostridium] leptum DSM 753]